MKKTPIYVITTFTLCLFMQSCNKGSIEATKDQSVAVSSNTRVGDEKFDFDAEGLFIYQSVKFHSFHFDPYTLISVEKRIELKAKVDSVRSLGLSDPEIVWRRGVQDKKITNKTYERLKNFKESGILKIKNNSDFRIVDKWFVDEIMKVKEVDDLNVDEKRFIIHHFTIMRYSIKAYLETNEPEKTSRNGKITANCTLEMISCYWGNVSTYSGIGGLVGVPGIGAIIGVLISFNSCTCEESCRTPMFISTPDVCYNSSFGLDLVTGGFGASTNHLTWTLMDGNGIPFLTKDSYNNTTRIYNSELGGRQFFQVSVTAYCNGGVYPTSRVEININNLGKPSFYLSGNTSPQVNSQQFYTITGRNLSIVTWGTGSIGQVLFQNPNGINVRWNSSGYAYLFANAQSDCGSVNSGLNVVVNN